jgi:MFS family permease
MTYPPGPPHPYGYGYPPPPPPPKPGVIPLAPLRVGDLLGGAFSAYGRYWKPLLGIAAIAYGGAGILVGGALLAAYGTITERLRRLDSLPEHADPPFDEFQPLFVGFGAIWLVAILGLFLATALVNAAVPAVVQEAVLGRPAPFGAVWRRAWSRIGPVIGSTLVSGLATVLPALLFGAGGILLVVGVLSLEGDTDTSTAIAGAVCLLLAMAALPVGVWLWGKFLLAPAAAVIEEQGPVAALRRSAALVRGSWWRIFGCTLLMILIVGTVAGMVQQVVSIVAVLPMSLVPVDDRTGPGAAFSAMMGVMGVVGLVQLLVQAAMAPFQPLVTSLLYVDQRIRKENLAPTLAESAGPSPV